MKDNHLYHQVALTLIDGIGVKNAKVLLAYLGNVEKIFDPNVNLRTEIPGFSKERYRTLNREKAL
ncbi:MAG TPA: hypothetical protein VFD80_01595, partial [Flavobacteriaceae bacterium]|nr:hypothetical protein [Flavobacteriaceae bacterium]